MIVFFRNNALIALLLLVGILFQTFQQSLVLADYTLETEKYMEFCENKEKPEMHCDGKCQLGKLMNELDGNQNPMQQHKVKIVEVQLFFQDAFQLEFEFNEDFNIQKFEHQFQILNTYPEVLLQPPIV